MVVEHEIQPKYLKAILLSFGVQLSCSCKNKVSCDLLHPLYSISKIETLALLSSLIQIFFEVHIGHFIVVLKFAVLFSFLLDGIIGEMYELIL